MLSDITLRVFIQYIWLPSCVFPLSLIFTWLPPFFRQLYVVSSPLSNVTRGQKQGPGNKIFGFWLSKIKKLVPFPELKMSENSSASFHYGSLAGSWRFSEIWYIAVVTDMSSYVIIWKTLEWNIKEECHLPWCILPW